jgi:ATP-dependent RNA helicase RhlE
VLTKRTLEGFDYQPRTAEKLEIPLNERLAAMRAQRSAGQARKAGGDRKPQAPAHRTASHAPGGARPAQGPARRTGEQPSAPPARATAGRPRRRIW